MPKPSLDLALQTLVTVVTELPDLAASADRIAFLHAMPHEGLLPLQSKLQCEQVFKPRHQRLKAAGFTCVDKLEGTYPVVLLLPERQREQTFDDFARAYDLLEDGGTLIVSLHNDWGAKRYEKHFVEVAREVEHFTKSHCRVFWAQKSTRWHTDAIDQWRGLARLRRMLDEQFWTKPGLFAWDRIDVGSKMLVDCMPKKMHGTIADLGAGWGFLSQHLLRTYPDITALDAFEADREGVEATRRNIGNTMAHARVHALWHDVTEGIQGRHYDFVVMNPPFHDGREPDPGLGMKFIAAAAQGLRSSGQLWLVANKNLPYEGLLAEVFGVVNNVAERDGYKVLMAAQPKHEVFFRRKKR